MLQRFLFITLTLCSLTASAQWQQTGAKVRYVNGLGIPTKDTAAGVAADSSQIVIRPQDSALYIKYKRTWVKVGGGSVSGTTNYVAKFTSATALGNSQIFDNGTNVGIGTTSPAYPLQVRRAGGAGSLGISIDAVGNTDRAVQYFSIQDNAAGVGAGHAFYYRTPSSTTDVLGYILDEGGNVGIGYTAPAAKLSVDGTTLINTNTDNGVDKLQVSGSMNVSAKATVETLSVTSNASVGGTSMLKGRTTVNPSATTVFTDRLFEISGTAGTTGSTQFAFVQNPTFTTPTTVYSWYNSLNVTSATTSYGLYYDAEGGTITNKWGLYFVGGSRNYLANTLLIGTASDNNIDKLQVNGSISGTGMKQNYVTKTGTYTATTDDYVIDCTSGTFTVNLPALVGRTGMVLIIKNSGAGTITVDPNGAAVIDGAATYSLSVQYSTIQIISDGTDWKIIAKF